MNDDLILISTDEQSDLSIAQRSTKTVEHIQFSVLDIQIQLSISPRKNQEEVV